MPFGPEGVPPFVEAAQAVLAPLAVGTAAASIVWSLQDRLVVVGSDLRDRAASLRDGESGSDDDDREQVRVLLRRARILQAAVLGFYGALLLQIVAASVVGLALAGFALSTRAAAAAGASAAILVPFFAGLVLLLAASALALIDTSLSFRAAVSDHALGEAEPETAGKRRQSSRA